METDRKPRFLLPTSQVNQDRYQRYLSDSVGKSVELLGAIEIQGGYRNRLWRLDISGAEPVTSVILRTSRSHAEPLADEVYPHNIPLEFETYRALRRMGLPVPEVWGLDSEGKNLGVPCFLLEFIEGTSLKDALRSGDPKADDLFLDAVCLLQCVTREHLGAVSERFSEGNTASSQLSWIAENLSKHIDDPLVAKVHARLNRNCPALESRFGNGDLSPSNMLVRDGKLVGLIDFEFAGFFDPLWEFLAPFGWTPEIRHQGLEERYCKRSGFDVELLEWYRPAALYGWWLGLLSDPDADYAGYTPSSCRRELEEWVAQGAERDG